MFLPFLILLSTVPLCIQAMDMSSGAEDDTVYTRPDIRDAVPRTFHWIATVAMLFLLPCLTAAFAFAGRLRGSLFLHAISGVYAIMEVLILSFADNDGVENRTSKGTGVSLLLLIWSNLLIGIVARRHLFSKISDTSTPITNFTLLTKIHATMSFLIPIAGFIKVCLAPVSMFGFCRDSHTGQCIAHGIMGTSFIFYGLIYCIVLVIPRFRQSESRVSQDHIDSWIMCLYGIVNTFTEHRWGREEWFMHDYQHTAMGIIWWCGGILGIYLSRNGRRTFVPSLIIMFTGWAMTQHHQHLEISTKVHLLFGLILTVGGALRIVEITFLLKDGRCASSGEILSFQYLAPFCLICAGTLFMSANEQQLVLVLRLGAEQSAYIMIIVSGAFLLTFWFLFSLDFYLLLVKRRQSSVGFLDKYLNTENEVHEPTTEPEFEMDSQSG
ncbi:Ytp1p KNAG_0F00780 [Huiozyma naganishii CBS 8797]|uniref:Protein YTP1-like C-terminal domain-containing protein n=1 Tax=Huiozyma naganishii (strain ATCC MYA-139 / BCRC 22969 / CBS 8797 / KCTC 17520 / NBRC 10181 / NCYC 3082 / Yp74L-3) TaxID=1071383 RepID=J7RZS8_HUIN7|nr:hypothetical protein KNAG_0F00780 [Kazachstania naganishii CBS 8797]CCK70747.1 hypothetical protein KNAG_0F00780 [Kazachstania naganishii CBS 8797]